MFDRKGLWSLVLTLLLVTPGFLPAQDFYPEPVDATLGAERDEYTSNKVPPLELALKTDDGRVRVIVQLEDPPLALYDGRVFGIKATRPSLAGTRKLDMKSAAARDYRFYLAKRHAELEKSITKSTSRLTVFERYDVVFNGVSVAVDPEMVEVIAAMPGVRKIFPDKLYYATMDASLPIVNAPEFWAELGGRSNAGAGVKVAVVDGGIRPENPMFDGTSFSFPPGFPLADDYCGAVDPGFCNGKLIAARHFRTVALHPSEHDSPLGFNGHGTHVAGTAVGNFVAGAAASDGVPEDISGVAPGAWLMVYKALWWNGSTGSGSSSDLIAAVNAAVADGADVINNSWGGPGGEDPAVDAFGPTFEAANAAGVLSVVAAGNSGPGADSIGCPGCHLVALTVGNTTTDRIHALGFSLSGGPSNLGCREGSGPALGGPLGPQTVVYAGDVGDPFACSALPAGSMTGSIALVSRGSCTFATKAANAAAAGADFLVVFNSVPGAPIGMGGLGGSTISSCMIGDTAGAAARAFVQANPGVQGQVNHPASRQTDESWQDIMASSSSRGPNGEPDFLKPDVAAPGTGILSAYSPEQGGDFAFLSGTSMASPHVAGAAALLFQKHPGWTPEQVKTALTSTAVRVLVKEDGVTDADAFDRGAGRLDLDRARRAGATFDLPSMAEDLCVVGCGFTRTLRNELPTTVTWSASVASDDPDLGITVTPSSITLASGESASFDVEVDSSLVDQGQWQFGAVVWSESSGTAPEAYLPIAVFPAGSTDSAQLTKTVDKAVAEQLETLTYNVTISNLTLNDPIDLVDEIPPGTAFVPGSASATVNGVPDPGFTFHPGSNSLTWSGVLDPLNLDVVPASAPFGYVPLSIFFAPQGCSSVCDDTFITLTGTGFNFQYAGATYTSVVMSSNGFIVAGGDTTNAFTPFNQNLPDAGAPNNVIAPFWTDLDMDGTSPTDSGGGIWYAGFLSAGPRRFLVMEWQNAQLFGAPGSAFTVQVWIEQGTSNIWFTYASIPFLPGSLTVGVEDPTGVAGSSRYFDGSGTAPAVGAGLRVATSPGGVAEFTFQVEAGCDLAPVVNIVDVTSGPTALTAFAATEIVPGPDADADGLPDACSDACPGTAIPESVPTEGLEVNHYALIDGDTVFDTTPPSGEGPGLTFTLEDTAGCSCEQIVDALELGEGHEKHGCSVGVMQVWVDQVDP